ncbi:MAG: PQQ-binding-like beta-propeller repeat protein [Thermoplasmata archaeon]
MIDINELWHISLKSRINSASIAEDASLMVVGNDKGQVCLLSRNGNILWTYETGSPVIDVSATSNANLVCAGCKDGGIHVVDMQGNLKWKFNTNSAIKRINIALNGRYLAAATEEGNVFFFEGDGNLLWINTLGSPATRISLSSSANYLAVGTKSGHLLFIDNYASHMAGKVLWDLDFGSEIYGLEISSDGYYLVASTEDRFVFYYDKYSKPYWKLRTDERITSLSMSSNGGMIVAGLAASSSPGQVCAFSREDRLRWRHFLGTGIINDIDISGDGKFAIAGTNSNLLCFFHKDQKMIWSSKTKKSVRTVAISYDGSYFLAGTDSGLVALFDASSVVRLFRQEQRKFCDKIEPLKVRDNGIYIDKIGKKKQEKQEEHGLLRKLFDWPMGP